MRRMRWRIRVLGLLLAVLVGGLVPWGCGPPGPTRPSTPNAT